MNSPSTLSSALFLLLLLSVISPSLAAGSSADLEAAAEKFAAMISPRSLQDKGTSSSNQKLLDFTELLDPGYADANSDSTDSFLVLVSDALIALKEYAESTEQSTVGNLAINDLVEGLLDEDGFVEFGIKDGYFLDLGANSAVNLISVNVKGLDTFREADLLRPTAAEGGASNYESPETVLQNTFVLETLVLDLLMIEYTDGNEETIVVRLPFSGVAVSSMPVLLALLEEGLKNFPLGAALNTNNTLPCLRETVVDNADILALEATFEEIGVPVLLETTDESPEASSSFFQLVTTLFIGVPASVPIFFNSTIRGLLNDQLLSKVLEEQSDDEESWGCPSYPGISDSDEEELIDFRSFFDEGLPALLLDLLDETLIAVDSDTGLPKINEVVIVPLLDYIVEQNEENVQFVSPTSDSNGGTSLRFGTEEEGLLDVATSIDIGGLSADVEMSLSDLKLYNLDTMVPPLEILKTLPEQAHQLNNTLTMGLDFENETERSLGVSANVFLSIETEENGSINHNISIKANMEALSLFPTILLEVAKSRLYGFPLKDITNLQCWLATIQAPDLNAQTGIRLEGECPTAQIADLETSLAQMDLDVACIGSGIEDSGGNGCESPGIQEWANLVSTPEAQEGATEFMNSVVTYAASLLSAGGTILQTPIDRILNEAPMQCPHNPYYDPEALFPISYESIDSLPEQKYSSEYLLLWGSIALALVAAFALVAVGIRCSARRKHRRWLTNTAVSSEEQQHLAKRQQEDDDLEEGLNAATDSLFCSREIPALVRWGMPLVVLGNIALFLSGHLNLGATVYVEASLAEETIKIANFFDFAIARSTIDIWNAGGKSLAILILVFSGIWPYTKQLLTLALWFLPTSRMSVSTRGSFLIWIDRLAKWSMIDIFVIVICLAAFRVAVRSPDLAFLPDEFYSVDLVVIPKWGLYSNMTAQLVSQVSSHFIIYYHRCIVKKATDVIQQISQKPEGERQRDMNKILLWAHHFSNPRSESSEKLVAKKWVCSLILGSSICMTVFVVLGSLVPSFSVEILGIIGVAIESGQDFEDAVTQHSVWSIVVMLFKEARFLDTIGDYIGGGVLGLLFLFTVMIVPILQALGLIYQWFLPLALEGRRKCSVINETLQAWQYIEVYLIALFVASWQLGPVSQNLFNVYCGSLDDFFAQMTSYGILKEEDAQCFTVQGSINHGSLSLLIASILLAIMNSVITLANNQCLWEYRNSCYEPRSGVGKPGAIEEKAVGVEEGIQSKLQNDVSIANAKARPFPVLFTDAYGWLVTTGGDSSRDDDVSPP